MKLHLTTEQLDALHVVVGSRRTTKNVTVNRASFINLLMDYGALTARVEEIDRSLAVTRHRGEARLDG